MKYCRSCLLPDTRPGLIIHEDGICSACRQHGQRPEVDWALRESQFRQVVASAKEKAVGGYDCLIPVSGGKDSTWQVLKCLEMGLKPLSVTWRPPGRNALGRENLDNLISLGVDHVDFSFNPEVERTFLRKAIEKYGNPGIPMHFGIYSLPLTLASRFRIPLIVYGENSAIEYGNAEDVKEGHRVDSTWKKHYGVTHGTTAEDWIDEDLTRKDLEIFCCPDDEALEEQGIRAVFLGYYFPWDPEDTLKVARENGFKIRQAGPKVGIWDYADVDDDFISVHHYLKWHKFGFTRSYDNLSLEIRNGRMTRDEGIQAIAELGDERPVDDLERFCEFLGMEVAEFDALADRFRNPKIWKREGGVWRIDDFLVPDWKWS